MNKILVTLAWVGIIILGIIAIGAIISGIYQFSISNG